MEYTIKPNPIKMWAEDDRPREKMKLKGNKALSDSELLAILIGSGTKEFSAIEVAKELLQQSNNDLQIFARKGIEDFQKVKGIGEAKAITIAAALELGRRRKFDLPPERFAIKSSHDLYRHLTPYFQDLTTENFYLVLLNRSYQIISTTHISMGGMRSTVADGKIIFKKAFDTQASAIALAHNHPSGARYPSENDVRLTKELVKFGKYIDLPIVDHIIYTDNGFYSFADNDML